MTDTLPDPDEIRRTLLASCRALLTDQPDYRLVVLLAPYITADTPPPLVVLFGAALKMINEQGITEHNGDTAAWDQRLADWQAE